MVKRRWGSLLFLTTLFCLFQNCSGNFESTHPMVGGADESSSGQNSPPAPEPDPSTPTPTPTPSPMPTQSDGPPLSFDDARFANIASRTTPINIANGGSLTGMSIVENSGAPSIVCQGSCTLTGVRVDSRECLRAVRGNLVISDSYLEATGSGDDHADVIQAYSPGSNGTLTLRDTSIVAHNTAATAGIFVADNWKADLIDLENVMFKGGPFGLRLHADGYANSHLRMKNVCFVGPFGFNAMLIDGFIIDEWVNVNECVIQNGKLVATKSIARP